MKPEMNNAVRDILRSLVQELGSDVNNNTQKWRGYLTDRLAPYRLERQALITTLNEHVPEELLSSQSSVPPQVQVERLTQRLVESLGLQPEVARWAVESWALVLGVAKPEELKAPPSQSRVVKTLVSSDPKQWRWSLIAFGAIGAIGITAIPLWISQAQNPFKLGFLPSLSVGGGGGKPNVAAASLTRLKVGAYIPVFQPDRTSDSRDAARPDASSGADNANPQRRRDPKEGYNQLKDHLKAELSKQLGRNIDVDVEFIEISGRDSFEQVKAKLQNKDWDLAFTQNPLLSVAAQQSGYQFAASMGGFGRNDEIQAALVTHVDSPIRSLEDLKNPDLTIALEAADNPRFYLSIYDAFGRTLKVDPGNSSSRDVINKVLKRKADLGVVPAQWITGEVSPDAPAWVKERRSRMSKELRFLSSTSRAIPTAGVYLSPNLDQASRELVQKVLIDAPENIHRAGRYAAGSQGDYSEFLRVVDLVDNKVLACTDPNKWTAGERVQFFCSNAVSGRVSSVAQVSSDTSQILLQTADGNMVKVLLPHQVSREAGLPEIGALHKKNLSVLNVNPNEQGAFQITNSKQIKLLDKQ